MIYLLDTDILTFVELPDSPEYLSIRAECAQLPASAKIATTIVNYEEQTRGWLAFAARSNNIDHLVLAYERLQRHLNVYLNLQVLGFTSDAAAVFRRLSSLKLRMGTADLKIASIALAHDATLVTRNHRDFARVPHLKVADWTRDEPSH